MGVLDIFNGQKQNKESSKGVNGHLNKGKELENLGRYEDAVKEFDLAIKSSPKDARLHSYKGEMLRRLGRISEAIKELDIAIKLDPELADAHTNKGAALDDLSKCEEAIKELDIAIKLNPKCAEAYSNKGNALGHLGRSEDAIKEYDLAIKLNPKFAGFYSNKGATLCNLGRWKDGIREIDTAIQLDPNNHRYLDMKNDALRMSEGKYTITKQFHIFKHHVGKEKILTPKDEEYHYILATKLQNLNERWEEVLKEWTTLIEMNPKKAEYHNGKGIALENLGWEMDAKKEFDAAIELDPDNSSYRYNRASIDTLNTLDIIINLHPKLADAHFKKGIVLFNVHNYNGAIKEFDAAIELDPDNQIYKQNKNTFLKRMKGR